MIRLHDGLNLLRTGDLLYLYISQRSCVGYQYFSMCFDADFVYEMFGILHCRPLWLIVIVIIVGISEDVVGVDAIGINFCGCFIVGIVTISVDVQLSVSSLCLRLWWNHCRCRSRSSTVQVVVVSDYVSGVPSRCRVVVVEGIWMWIYRLL